MEARSTIQFKSSASLAWHRSSCQAKMALPLSCNGHFIIRSWQGEVNNGVLDFHMQVGFSVWWYPGAIKSCHVIFYPVVVVHIYMQL